MKEYKEYSDSQKEKIKKTVMAWAEEFTQDERYKILADNQKSEAMFIIDVFADFMYGYFLEEPSQWTAAALEECCLDILPRKVSADLNFYKSVEPVLTGFLQFLQNKGRIRRASSLISRLKKVSGTMIELAENPENWGQAKRIIMEAMEEGVNIENPEELDRYIQLFNPKKLNNSPVKKVKVGRNDPCPCGSGKKYKKCCGAAGNVLSLHPKNVETAEENQKLNRSGQGSEKLVYQLKVVLKKINPPIWRRILVPQNITFYKLHKIIQAAFGWQDYHLFDFEFSDVAVHIPDPDYAPGELHGGKKELNAKRTKIDELLLKHKHCIYTYDFGDDWRHEVTLEKVLPAEEGQHYPFCTAGARHRPPEDVGGVGGYREFLRIIQDPKHPEYNDYLIWAEKDTGGRKFDPEYFYLNEINRVLAKIK